MHLDVHTLAPEGVVPTIAGVDKAREAEVLMLEELEHQDVDMENKEVEKHWAK